VNAPVMHPVHVRQACSGEGDVLALAVTRYIASAYLTGDAVCWEAAHDHAERELGLAQGARLVAAMSAVMRALRAERGGMWTFMPASCCRVTDDELELIRLMALARLGPGSAIEAGAARLARQPEAPRLAAAVREAVMHVPGPGIEMLEAHALQ
jgi:hypothetical protein